MELPKILKSTSQCDKIYQRSKYDTKGMDSQKWWNEEIKDLFQRHTTPAHKKQSILAETFSNTKVIEINKCYSVLDDMYDEEIFLKSDVVEPAHKSRLFVPKIKKQSIPEPSLEWEFMKKSKENARIWRPKQKVILKKIPIIERTEIIEEMIISAFYDKFSSLTPTESEINKDMIKFLFRTIFGFPIRESLSIQSKVLGAIPRITAKYLGFPELARREYIQSLVKEDIKFATGKSLLIAFSKCLPWNLQHKPFKQNLREQWISQKVKHKTLDTFQEVFIDLKNLETTRRFCLWLLDNPQIVPPQFIVDEGWLNWDLLKDPYPGEVYVEDIDWCTNMDTILNECSRVTYRAKNNCRLSMSGDLPDIRIIA